MTTAALQVHFREASQRAALTAEEF